MLQLPVAGEFPSLSGGLEWVNSNPLTPLSCQKKPIRDRQFEIEFSDAGVQVCDFTFG